MEQKASKFYLLELTLLGAIWGASFLFMRVAVPEFGPFSLIFLRTLIAALVLLPTTLFSGAYKLILKRCLLFIWLGGVTVAAPFTLFAYVTLHVTAGTTSILNATTSMFSAIFAWLWLKETLSYRASAGVLIGFLGVTVLSLGKDFLLHGRMQIHVLSLCAALLAAACYGYGSCFVRKYMHAVPSSIIAAGGQFGAAILLLPLGWYYWPATMPGYTAWSSGILLGVFCTAIALIMYFDLLKKVGVARTVSVTLLIPVFSVLWGTLFLDEALTPAMLAGGVLVLMGVGLTNSKKPWGAR